MKNILQRVGIVPAPSLYELVKQYDEAQAECTAAYHRRNQARSDFDAAVARIRDMTVAEQNAADHSAELAQLRRSYDEADREYDRLIGIEIRLRDRLGRAQ